MPAHDNFIYQTQQILAIEKLALEKFNLSNAVLMQRAGQFAAEFLQKRWPQAKTVTVFCGGGNNGGDGYVLAYSIKAKGLKVMIVQVGNHHQVKDNAHQALLSCKELNIPIFSFDASNQDWQKADVIVDAICGIGLQKPLNTDLIQILKTIHSLSIPILALDLPTGVDADTGKIWGYALAATATITFIAYKLGLLTGSGLSYTGELICYDLMLSPELFSWVKPLAQKIPLKINARLLKPRPRDWHKGLSGHVVIVGGDLGYSGAPSLAAQAALRVGAGLVSVITHPENARLMNLTCPEIMCHAFSAQDEIKHLLEKAKVIVLGTGLGLSDWSKSLYDYVCQFSNQTCPKVVDADGLNLLARNKVLNANWVLTPHPGEAGRLLDLSSQEIQSNRLFFSQEIQKRYGGVCVLKGAGSLIVTDSMPVFLCDKGNPGMATAGMGDILSGVIGGLIAQGLPLFEAAQLGVAMHAQAGDYSAKAGERGMLASDLLPYLRELSNPIEFKSASLIE